MPAHMDDTEMNRAAQRLARALRSGLELRWSLPEPSPVGANPFPPVGNVRSFLEPDADSIHLHLEPRGNLLDRVLRGSRFLMRKLIAPWLVVQTRFNRASISVVEQVDQRVRALENTQLALLDRIETLETMLQAHSGRTNARPNDKQ